MQKEWKGQTVDEVATQPAPEWLIEGVLPEHGTSLLYGKSGVGKSFVGADVAYAVFTGQPWHGHAVNQGGVVYVATEGIDGLGMRFSALRQRAGNPPEAPSTVVPGEVNLLDTEEVASFVAYVRDLGGVRLVVLDTLNRCMPGVVDENSNAAMSQAVRGAERIAEGTGAHVLIVHHTGKNGMSARGGYALECNTDARFRIGTPNTPALAPGGILTLYNEKQRNTGNTPRIELKAELVTLPDGSTTLVLSDVLGKTRAHRGKDTKKQILALAAKGKTAKEIAAKLDVNYSTVTSTLSRARKPHLARIPRAA